MRAMRKRLLCPIAAALMWFGSALASGAQEPDAALEARLDELFAQLAEPGRDDWQRIEREINRIWSRSGSETIDLLLRRGNAALEQQDYAEALEHFSTLTDHAPDFAEGWNARATTFFLMDEYSLSIADVEHVLALNPRHFGALSGLAIMLEQMGENELALRALREVHALHPNRPDVADSIRRLEAVTGAAEL
jgi:tetratricopeptide (TPR) repeat protein